MYIIMKLAMGGITETPSDIASSQIRYLRGQLASYFLSYISLWCVKLSFLFFLRKLGQRYRLQRILWWTILALVVVSIGPVFGMLDYECELSSIEDIAGQSLSMWPLLPILTALHFVLKRIASVHMQAGMRV